MFRCSVVQSEAMEVDKYGNGDGGWDGSSYVENDKIGQSVS